MPALTVLARLAFLLVLGEYTAPGHGVEVEVSPGGDSNIPPQTSEVETSVVLGRPPELLLELQKHALLELFEATNGEAWTDKVAWGSGDPCQWFGIQCHGQDGERGFVTEIELVANKLNGTIPDIFDDLPYLRTLDLSLNYLRGAVPTSIGKLAMLERLDLGYNYLMLSLKLVSTLRQLEFLSLRWNTLITGSLQDISPYLRRLETLDLRDNKMTSLTMAGLGDMPSLRTVHFEKSGLGGAFDLEAIRHLTTFIASGNRLEGDIILRSKSSDNALKRLVTLDLANNMLSGRIPRLQGATELIKITLQNNNFYDSGFTLRDHPRIEHVDLSGNVLDQPFPLDFFRAASLVKFLCANCGLRGVLPLPNKGVSTNPNLEELVLYNNELFGRIPEAIWNLPSLRVLDVSNNRFSGKISSAIGRVQHLEILHLASNNLSGELPQSMEQLYKLHSARLEHNSFSGVLPPIFEKMKLLQTFAIHGNYFTRLPEKLPPHVQTWPLGLREAALGPANGRKSPANLILYDNKLTPDESAANDDVMVYRVCGTMNDFFHNTLARAGWVRTKGDFFHASYGKCYGDSDDANARSLMSMQRASRFPYVGQLSDKGLLTHNIEAMRRMFPNEYSFYPRSFTIPAQLDEYRKSFEETARALENPEKDNLWLMKPRARCCGEGIRIINKAEDAARLVDPNLGEWYTQKFVSPPALIDGHKFVFRLFALVTSFSPLRVQLFHDGLIFYTFTEYSVADQAAKRSYISDYFFTSKQTDYFLFAQDYIDALRKTKTLQTKGSKHVPASVAGGKEAADKLWEDIKALVAKSLIAGASWTSRMQQERTQTGTVYEIFGYDIVLDDELKPYLCEINETPNMGLEVNYHPDYHGKGEIMEKQDYEYKTRLMDATLAVANVEPRYSGKERANIRKEVIRIVQNGDFACLSEMEHGSGHDECLSAADVSLLVDLEAELRRGEVSEYDEVFPCAKCQRYFEFMRHTNLDWGDLLGVWWMQLRSQTTSPSPDLPSMTWSDFLKEHLPHIESTLEK